MALVRFLMLGCFLVLAACGTPDGDGATSELVPLGDFRMGHNITVGTTARQIPPSRTASADEWKSAMQGAMQKRFGRYDGAGLYHFGVSVDAYALAIPGIPIALSPKSALVVSVTVWDNSTQSKLNEEVKQITVFETLSAGTVIGSGLTKTKAEQMDNLVTNAAFEIQKWMVENKAWFE